MVMNIRYTDAGARTELTQSAEHSKVKSDLSNPGLDGSQASTTNLFSIF